MNFLNQDMKEWKQNENPEKKTTNKNQHQNNTRQANKWKIL